MKSLYEHEPCGKFNKFNNENFLMIDFRKDRMNDAEQRQNLGNVKIHHFSFGHKCKLICAIIMFVCATTVGVVFAHAHSRKLQGVGGHETVGFPRFSNSINLDGSDTDFVSGEAIENIGSDIAEAVMEMPADFENSDLTYFTYRVKQGDMIGIIAENFGITQDTIISVNNIRQSRLIQIGQFLKIPSMPGILYTAKKDEETLASVAEKYEVNLEKCAAVNGISSEQMLSSGTTIFVPDAMLDWATLQEINGDLFIKPVRTYRLTSYFGWRKSPFSGARSYHSGVDMAAPSGTPIYAALSGRVTVAGFNATYGNYVIVTHHSGYQTLYGHMSTILVNRGQYVDTNTRIGRVGSTGLSTGPHLHFTVMKNGSAVNPIALWK